MAKIRKAERPDADQALCLSIAETIQQQIPGNYGMNRDVDRRVAVERAAWLAFQTRELIETAYDKLDGKAYLLRCLDSAASDKVTE